MMLRCTSLVPPAIDSARLPRKPPIHAFASPSSTAAAGTEQFEAHLLHALFVLDADQLADAGLGPGLCAGQRAQRGSQRHRRDGV